jgi:hypothetical protein
MADYTITPASTLNIRTIYDNTITGFSDGQNAILQYSDVKMEIFVGTERISYLPYRTNTSSYFNWWGGASGNIAEGFVANMVGLAYPPFPCIGRKISNATGDEGFVAAGWLAIHPQLQSYTNDNRKLSIKITPQNNKTITGYTLYYQDQSVETASSSIRIETGQNATRHQYDRLYGANTTPTANWSYVGSYEGYAKVFSYTKDLSTNPITSTDFLYVNIDDAEDLFSADAGTIKMVLNTSVPGQNTPTPLTFINNTLTVTNDISATDIDLVSFLLPAKSIMYSFNVTSLLNSNSITYSLDISGGANVSSGTITSTGVNLLGGNNLRPAVDTTYILNLTAGSTNTYTIIGKMLGPGYTLSGLIAAGGMLPWNSDDTTNRLKQSYVKDFIDISGSLMLRNNAKLYVEGNTTVNGKLMLNNTNLQADLSFNRRIFVGSDMSANGNVTIANDVSLNGVVTGCILNANSIPISAFKDTVTSGGPDYTKASVIYPQKFRANGDVSMNGNTVQVTNMTVNGNIEFNDGTKMSTYDDNKSVYYNLPCIDTSYSLIPTTYNTKGAQGILCSEDGKYVLSLYGPSFESGGGNPYYNNSNVGLSGLFLSKNYGITYSLVSLPTVATDPSGGSLTANNLIISAYACAAISSTGKYMMCSLTGTGNAQNSWQNSVIAFSSDYGETWSTQFIWRFLKQHSLVSTTAIVMGLAVNTDASVIAVSVSSQGTYISTDYMNSFSVRNAMPTSGFRGRLDILGNNRILIPITVGSTSAGIRIFDLSGNSKYSNTTLIPTHPYLAYSASRSGNVIAVANSWNNNNSMPPYCYLITTNDGTNYTTTSLTPSGVASTALPGIYNGTTVIAGHTTLTCMVSPSGKYVLFGPNIGFNYSGMVLDLISYPFYYSDNYGKDANQNYIFTKVTNPPFSRGGLVNYRSTNITENGFIYMHYPDENANNTVSRKIVRLDFRKFKASTFSGLTIKNTLTAGTFVVSSDYRIKTNVAKLDNTFTVDNLRPVKYWQTLLNKQQYGLIAHELQQYYPNLVFGEKDGPDLQRVNYTGLIAILINEINQLKRVVAEQEKKRQNTQSIQYI